MKRYIFLLMSSAILVTGCTSTSNLKKYTGNNGESYYNNTGIKQKLSERNKKESFKTHHKDKSIADTNPSDTSPDDTDTDTGTDTSDTVDSVNDNTDSTNTDTPVDNSPNQDSYDPLTDGLYGPHT